MKLIINADDFGLSKGVNRGIIDSFTQGIVTSTTLMANSNAFEDAVSLVIKHPDLGVGVHCVLDAGKPISDPSIIQTLVKEDGTFKRFNDEMLFGINQDELKLELSAQIDKVLNTGIKISHLDSHHHLHMHPAVFETFIKIAQKYNVPIRVSNLDDLPKHQQLLNEIQVDYVVSTFEFYQENLEPSFFLNLDERNPQLDILEVMTHPAYVDDELLELSSYNSPRAIELDVLTDPITKEFIKKYTMINYHDVLKEN